MGWHLRQDRQHARPRNVDRFRALRTVGNAAQKGSIHHALFLLQRFPNAYAFTDYYTGPGKADGAVDFHQAWGINQAWNFTKIDAALWSNTASYFFCGNRYIRIWHSNSDDGAGGSIDAGYPAPISQWGWGNFGTKTASTPRSTAAPVDYFFSGNQYIRVTRGKHRPRQGGCRLPATHLQLGLGCVPAQTALTPRCTAVLSATSSRANTYIRVTRGDECPGKMDPGYPAPISKWNWNGWGANGIDSALFYGFVTL